jgi:flagellar hook-basal body complex protein FliE
MSSEAISSILSQIRGLQSQVAPLRQGSEGVGAVAPTGQGFAATLSNALRQVNATQAESARVAQAFEMGDPRADLVRVMVASQESQVAFRATVEVRNRLVQAYQDVMNMPI